MKYLLFIASLVVFAGCSPQIRVYSDHDPDYQVGNFKTFDWGQKISIEANQNPLHYNELNDKRIKSAVLRELTSRGYTYSASGADMVIHYHIIVDDQSIVTTEPYGYRYGPYWMHARTHVYSYREGTLIIDLMDPKTGALVWRGWAKAALDNINPGNTEKVINLAVSGIFKEFSNSAREEIPMVSEQSY